MDIRIWDEEFRETARRVDKIQAGFHQYEETFVWTIARKQRVLARCQLAIDRIHVRFHRMNQIKEGLPRRLEAVLFWTAEMASKTKVLLKGTIAT